MNACNDHQNCTILNVKLPRFARPQNLSLVEHILGMIVRDGFGEYAYFEALPDNAPTVIDKLEIIEKPRFAFPEILFRWFHRLALPSYGKLAELVFVARWLVAFFVHSLQPRGSPFHQNGRRVYLSCYLQPRGSPAV